jgi:hypothetical protein
MLMLEMGRVSRKGNNKRHSNSRIQPHENLGEICPLDKLGIGRASTSMNKCAYNDGLKEAETA